MGKSGAPPHNLFTPRSKQNSSSLEMIGGAMSKILRCSELIPGCDFVARADTDEEVMEQAARHVRVKHNLQKMSAGVVAIIRGAICDDENGRPKQSNGSAHHAGQDGASDGNAGAAWWTHSGRSQPN